MGDKESKKNPTFKMSFSLSLLVKQDICDIYGLLEAS